MQITGHWTLAQLQPSKIDCGVMPIPALKRPAAVVGAENLFLMKTSPEREKAATEFLEYVQGAEFQTAWALGTGYLRINLQSRKAKPIKALWQKTRCSEYF